MTLTILLAICAGFDLGGITYYNGTYKKQIKIGFGFALCFCLLSLISGGIHS